ELAADGASQNVMRRTRSATEQRSAKAGPTGPESKVDVHALPTVASLRPRSVERRKLHADSGLRGRDLRLLRRLCTFRRFAGGQCKARRHGRLRAARWRRVQGWNGLLPLVLAR